MASGSTEGHPSSSAYTREKMVVEGSSEPISLKGVVDLSNTTDTDETTNQLPAVVHEKIIPTVHHVQEEAITREVHTHDVFHRIQPVIDVEVLPTKHFVPSRSISGNIKLIEVPEESLPGRQPNWHIATGPEHSDQDDNAPTVPRRRPAREPKLSSKRDSLTHDGIPKTESVWRHDPVLERGGRESGQTVPLRFETHGDYESDSESVGDRAIGEESLLFQESGYGLGGMLPGLPVESPMSPSAGSASAAHPPRTSSLHPVVEEDAGRAGRRRGDSVKERELQRKMAMMSVRE